MVRLWRITENLLARVGQSANVRYRHAKLESSKVIPAFLLCGRGGDKWSGPLSCYEMSLAFCGSSPSATKPGPASCCAAWFCAKRWIRACSMAAQREPHSRQGSKRSDKAQPPGGNPAELERGLKWQQSLLTIIAKLTIKVNHLKPPLPRCCA